MYRWAGHQGTIREERAAAARLAGMRPTRLILGLALTGLVILAVAGAAVQLARGERPLLLAT
jgi:hypothetical protein